MSARTSALHLQHINYLRSSRYADVSSLQALHSCWLGARRAYVGTAARASPPTLSALPTYSLETPPLTGHRRSEGLPQGNSSVDEVEGFWRLYGSGTHTQPTFHVGPPLAPAVARTLGDYGTYAQGFVGESAQAKISYVHVALAMGQTARAKSVFLAIEKNLGYERYRPWSESYGTTASRVKRTSHSQPALCQVVGPSVHAAFIRRILADALKARRDGQVATQRQCEADAFEWLQNLRYNGPSWGTIDHHVVAAAIKGFLQLRESVSPLDLMPWVEEWSELSASTSPNFVNILTSITFTATQPSYLGTLTPLDALDILETLATDTRRGDVLKELAVIRPRLTAAIAESGAHIDAPANRRDLIPSLDPVKKPPKPSDTGLDQRTVPLRLGHLLSNIGTIVESAHHAQNAYDRQLLLENSGFEAAQAEWYDANKSSSGLGARNEPVMLQNTLQSWMWEWYEVMRKELDRLDELGADVSSRAPQYEDFRRVLPNDVVAKLVVVETLRGMGNRAISDGVKSIALFIDIGRAIEREWHAQALKSAPGLGKAMSQAIQHARRGVQGSRSEAFYVRRLWIKEQERLTARHGIISTAEWTTQQRAQVGALLLQILLNVARVERVLDMPRGTQYKESQPAFYSTFQYLGGKRVGVIKVNEVVAARLDRDPSNIALHPRHLPMLAPPLPWTSPENGAYLIHGAPFMRLRDSPEQAIHVKEANKVGGLDYVYRGLDKLGSTVWAVNRPVYDVMSSVWNSGEALAGIPVRDPITSLTDSPSGDPQPNLELDNASHRHSACKDPLWQGFGSDKDGSPDLEVKDRQAYRALLIARRNAYGQRCHVNYQLEIARAYLEERFYFPHNIDFRGRAYPIPPNLNHMGDDICRGLLTFGTAQRLGAQGLKWLKIHVANKAGYDKASLEEREAFADANLFDIYDSADAPLNGRKWWLKSDDPWQTLAACIELTKAMRHPIPEDFESSLPVHQDGSCNGLQHYAALGGDVEGGRQVNLIPGDRPGDVYSKVAVGVARLVEEDARQGHEIANGLKGHVSRKVVKQTVMTTVYGVTFVGAREQIRRQLKDLDIVPVQELFSASTYLATQVFKSIGEVFKGAVALQEWFTQVARLVTRSIPPERIGQPTANNNTVNAQSEDQSDDEAQLMTSMTWTTPLGLVVCQPYRKEAKSQVKTVMQTVSLQDPGLPGQADSRSQASAFPPNFVHSLDATHMLLTALACEDIAFAAVHDSFWTHAADVEHMNARLREAFVQLHETPILTNLVQEVRHRYDGFLVPRSSVHRSVLESLLESGVELPAGKYIPLTTLLPPLPPRGELNVRDVMASDYFFS